MIHKENHSEEGGVGGPMRPNGRHKSDPLLERALRCGWDVPDAAKKLAVERMNMILEKTKSPRAMIAATRMLDAMQKTTLSAITVAIAAEQHELGKQDVADVENGVASEGQEVPRDQEGEEDIESAG